MTGSTLENSTARPENQGQVTKEAESGEHKAGPLSNWQSSGRLSPNRHFFDRPVLLVLIILSLALVSGIGTFTFQTGHQYRFENQYGQIVDIFGAGIYAHDSNLKAGIFAGTDAATFFITLPLLIFTGLRARRKESPWAQLVLLGLLAAVLYYAASVSLGVTFNRLFLIYILLFSLSLFSLAVYTGKFLYAPEAGAGWDFSLDEKFPRRGFRVFCWGSALAIALAWLPEIIIDNLRNAPLVWQDVYTTEVTYVIDLAIVCPSLILADRWMKKEKKSGYILAVLLLFISMVIGYILPVQTLFQTWAGYRVEFKDLLTKVIIFVALSLLSLYFINQFRRHLHIEPKA